jgi:hypothetical protein
MLIMETVYPAILATILSIINALLLLLLLLQIAIILISKVIVFNVWKDSSFQVQHVKKYLSYVLLTTKLQENAYHVFKSISSKMVNVCFLGSLMKIALDMRTITALFVKMDIIYKVITVSRSILI